MDGDNGFVLDQSGTIASELLSVALVALKAVSPVLPRRNGQKRDIQVPYLPPLPELSCVLLVYCVLLASEDNL